MGLNKVNMSAVMLFRILHIVWALLGVIACVILVTSKGGHPPGIILLPIALIFWVVGHILLWIISKLFARGKKSEVRTETDVKKWPLFLIILAVLLGGVFIFGFMAIILFMVLENDWLSGMPAILALWLPPSLCFIGILLHKSWSRLLAGWGFIGVAMIILYQLVESALRNYTASVTEWVIAIAILIFSLLIGQHILRSPKIKAFYAE
jgi:hypothetical protein